MNHLYLLSAVFTFLLFQSGCSLFFGNIKPVEEKSTNYGVLDLSSPSANDPEWMKIPSETDPSGGTVSGIADMSFQSKKTASIISINSACKRYSNDRKETLSTLTRELLLGISEVSYFKEKTMTLDGQDALQTTIQGKMNQENMMLRTVVVQNANCIYDLMYISRPEKFKTNEDSFSRFVSSLKLK